MDDKLPGPHKHQPLDSSNYGEEGTARVSGSKPPRATDTIKGGESQMGRIDDIRGRVDHYVDQGMNTHDAAEAAYEDIVDLYEEDAVKMSEVQTAVQELETYVENRGGDLQASAASLEATADAALDRATDASSRMDDVYNDLL